jgi:hypothetical protein
MTRDEFMADPVLLWLKADKEVEAEWLVAAYRSSPQFYEAVLGHLVRSISRVQDLSQARSTAQGLAKYFSKAEAATLKEAIAEDLVEDEEPWRKDFDAIFSAAGA